MTSLKIISFVNLTEDLFRAISLFIEGRPFLRRLDISLNPVDWVTFAPILLVIADLKGLKAIGLTIPFVLSTDNYSLLIRHLPDQLEALRLKVDLLDPLLDHGPLSVIMQKLRQMHSLGFLSLHRYGSSKLYPFADDIALDLKQLSLLYLDRNIWDVDRTGPKTVLLPWSIRKKYLKIKDNFQNEDAEWLLRHGDFPPFI